MERAAPRLRRDYAEGATVLSTRGLQAESDLPFAGVSELLAPVLDHLPEIPSPQRAALEGALARGPVVPGDRFAAYVGVLSLLAAAAEEATVLALVDDAHWLDSASGEALVFVARRLADERIALLFAAREGEAARFEAESIPELLVGGLREEDARALLAAHHGGDVSPAVAARLWQATAGNPLALLELPGVLSEAQLEGRDLSRSRFRSVRRSRRSIGARSPACRSPHGEPDNRRRKRHGRASGDQLCP
ncbi:MAG TPA: hypothetical protein VGV57_12725 [Thermoleophilaceae bacterium]|nr:hypothetical protein [Thermoleophilaceae bacterium]